MMKFKLPKVLLLLFICGAMANCVLANAANADGKNLITNGDFAHVANGKADGWNILKGEPGSTVSFPLEAKDTVARIDLAQNKKGAYLSQWVNLEPHQNYRLSLRAKMSGGKLTFAIGNTGLNKRMFGETREELPMSPYFWDESWLNSIPFVPDQWRAVSFDFNSKDVTKALVSLGGFFVTGSYYFDDVTLVKIP